MVWIRNQEVFKSRFKALIVIVLTAISIYCALHYSKECADGVRNGLMLCVTVLIPSLFIFMVIASYIADSKAIDIVAKLFEKPVYYALGLPKASTGAIIMSLLGGYPVGAKSVATIYKNGQLNERQAEKLSMITVCAGPGFIMNFVGAVFLQNKQASCILFVSQLVGFISVAIIVGKSVKVKDEAVAVTNKTNKTNIVDAVSSGCNSTIIMCGMVIAFSALLELTRTVFSAFPKLCDALNILLEVTSACSKTSTTYPLYVLSFAIGFGGICVHFQVFSILKDIKVNKALFFLFRIIQGITAAFTTYILLILFPNASKVFSTVVSTTPAVSSNTTAAVALILTAVCFLNSLSYSKYKRR